jgi:hypothetical protein
MDFNINFMDRQKLKLLEDSVIELEVIFDTMITDIKGVRMNCEQCCQKICIAKDGKCDCIEILHELDLHITEVELHIKRAKVLRGQAEATAKLVSLSSLIRIRGVK